MKITKRQLKRIIKEESLKLLREITPGAAGQAATGGLTPADQGSAAAAADEAKPDNNTHHWPRVDWTNVEELVDKWAQEERDAFDKGDPVMMGMGETYNESKGIWDMQVENASIDLENELTDRVRKVALQTMKEITDRLIEGEYA